MIKTNLVLLLVFSVTMGQNTTHGGLPSRNEMMFDLIVLCTILSLLCFIMMLGFAVVACIQMCKKRRERRTAFMLPVEPSKQSPLQDFSY